MMKQIRYGLYILLFLLTCAGKSLLAQDHLYNKVWMMSTYSGIDFNSGVPVPISGAMNTLEGMASATGPDGKLLFYTDGSTVWNSLNEVMANGTDLAPYYNKQPGPPTYSCSQAAVIVPMPDSSKYYIFSLTHMSGENNPILCYSIVDMRLNNCLGEVEPARKGIMLDHDLAEKMTAVRGNDCNIWLVVHDLFDPVFKSYQITSAGINRVPVISNSGSVAGYNGSGSLYYGYGVMKISPDRTKLALVSQFGLESHQFNPSNGIVSNYQVLDKVDGNLYGLCFSPDNTKLYATYPEAPLGEIYQFDLSLPDLAAIKKSKTIITDEIIHPSYSLNCDMQIGPDNKIYVGGFSGKEEVNNLFYIDKPNLAGIACKFTGMPFAWPNGYGPIFGKPNNFPVLIGHDTVYSTTLIKLTGCKIKEPIVIDIPDGRDILWDGKSLCSPPVITGEGVYIIKYLSPKCIYRIDTLIVPSVPKLTSAEACAITNNFALFKTGPGDTLSWNYNWRNEANQSIRTYTGSYGDSIKGVASGNYTVRLTNANGCDTSFSFTITAPPHIISTTNGEDTVCIGDTIQFSSLSSTEPIKSYHWDFGDNATSDEKDPSHIFGAAKPYTVIYSAVSEAGCASDVLEIAVTVLQLPYVNAGPDRIIIKGNSTELKGSTITKDPVIRWEPLEYLSDEDTLSPTVKPPATQLYYLYITDTKGCTAYDSALVKVFPEIRIPNAFSPNGDGINDVWGIPGLAAYPGAVVMIFNRWGQLVFESKGYTRPWDGNMNGKPLPVGVYYYIIKTENAAAGTGEIKFSGSITLLR